MHLMFDKKTQNKVLVFREKKSKTRKEVQFRLTANAKSIQTPKSRERICTYLCMYGSFTVNYEVCAEGNKENGSGKRKEETWI